MKVFWNYFSIFTIALILCTNAAWALNDTPEEYPPPTPEQLKNIQAFEEREKYRDLPDCEGEAEVLIGPYIFLVPRTGYNSLSKKEQKNAYDNYRAIRRPQPGADCEREFFDDVWRIRISHENTPEGIHSLSISYEPEPLVIDSYDSFMRGYSKNKEKYQIKKETLADGAELYKNDISERYVFPVDKFETKSGKPIVFSCTPGVIDRCSTRYILPNGIRLSYELIYKPDSQYLFEIERKARALVLDMILEELPEPTNEETPHTEDSKAHDR